MGERGDGATGRARRAIAGGALAAALIATAAGCTDPGGGGGGGGGGGRGGELSVLSYNVAGLPQEISSENPEEHIPLISPLLDEYDIVLTQDMGRLPRAHRADRRLRRHRLRRHRLDRQDRVPQRRPRAAHGDVARHAPRALPLTGRRRPERPPAAGRGAHLEEAALAPSATGPAPAAQLRARARTRRCGVAARRRSAVDRAWPTSTR